MDIIELPYVTISKIDKNTIKAIYQDKCVIDDKSLEETRSIYTNIYGNENLDGLKLIVIFQGETKFDLMASKTYMLSRYREKSGEAFITKNPITIMYLKSIIQITKPKHPLQIFKTENEGMNWLNTIGND